LTGIGFGTFVNDWSPCQSCSMHWAGLIGSPWRQRSLSAT